MTDRLTAWLYGTPVADLTRGPELRIEFTWRPEGADRWGFGSPILSTGFPVGSPTGPRDLRGTDFFDNLLPEGPALERMAVLAGVRRADSYGILEAFGRDCAGAIMILPHGELPGRADAGGYEDMTAEDLRAVIGRLDAAPLAAAPERGFRPSLAGFQRKALLGRAADGTWQRPHGNAPSTWILKPDGPHPMAANEATCMQLAAASGLNVPQCELLDVAGLPVLAVRRYDRTASAGGLPGRIHQEDGCQATAVPPGMKYEEQGGPTLRDFAALLQAFGDPAATADLLRRTTFNMAIGNADAHAKNFSVLHDPDGRSITVAPLYDLLATIALGFTASTGREMHADTHLGQHVGGRADITEVKAANLADEAVSWGMRRRSASAIITETIDRVLAAIPEVAGDEHVLSAIEVQAQQVRGR